MAEFRNLRRDDAIKDFGSGNGSRNTIVLFIILMTFSISVLMYVSFRYNNTDGRSGKGTDYEEFSNCSVHLSREAKFAESDLKKNNEVNFKTIGLFPYVDIYGNSREKPIANAFGAYITSYEDLEEAKETFGLNDEEINQYDKIFFEQHNLALLLSKTDIRDPYQYVYVGNKKDENKEYIQFEKDTRLEYEGEQVHAFLITLDKDVPFVAFELKTNRILRTN